MMQKGHEKCPKKQRNVGETEENESGVGEIL